MSGATQLMMAGLLLVTACTSRGESPSQTTVPQTPDASSQHDDSMTVDSVQALDTTPGPNASDISAGTEVDAAIGSPADVPPSQPDAADATEHTETTDSTASMTEFGGGILVTEVDSAFVQIAGAGARFVDPTEDNPPDASFGDCDVSWSDPDIETPEAFGYDAGKITIVGTSPPITLTPTDEGEDGIGYTSSLPEDTNSIFGQASQNIHLQGLGGVHIPAFELTLTGLQGVDVSSPTSFLPLPINTPTNSALQMGWNIGDADSTLITITPLSDDFKAMAGYQLSCAFAGDPGSFNVPAEALAMVRDGASSQNAVFGITRIRHGLADADGIDIPAALTRSNGGLLDLTP